MQQVAAVRSLKQAERVIKQMEHQSPEWMPNLHELGRRALRGVLHQHMQRQVRRYLVEATRQGVADRRNGSYRRHLLTALGDLELCVPRTRRFSALAGLQAYARRERRVDRLILGCFVLGLSTRKVGEALMTILGERVSPATVSEVAKLLDREVAAFHRRRLAGPYRVLVFDGVVLSRRTGAGAIRRPVLVALGLRPDGQKEILDFVLAPAESQPAWELFLTDLQRRGLTAAGLELIVTDGGKGLLAALPTVFPGVEVQRCWAHKSRNVLDQIRKAHRERAKRDLRRISHAPDQVAARRAARRFADRWEDRYPRAVRCLRADLDELLAFLRFDHPTWRKAARTTNAIERRFREVRRRTRPMGTFSDRTSMERILYAVFTHENRKQGTAAFLVLS